MALLNIVKERLSDIESEAQKALVPLTISWSYYEETSQFATNSLDLLISINQELSSEIISNWIERVLLDLSDKCIGWLGSKFVSALNENHRNQLTAQLKQIFQPSNVNEEKGKRYHRLMGKMPEEAIQSNAIQTHLRSLFSQPTLSSQYPDYLHYVFPAFPRLINYGPQAQTGSMIQNLFTSAKNNPTLFGWLHAQMADYWPAFNTYNPQQIFNEAKFMASQYPNNELFYNVLSSMCRMIQRGIVSTENINQVIETACALWPYHQEQSLQTFLSFNQVPNLQQLSNLIDNTNPKESVECDRLFKAWSHMADIMTEEQRIELTQNILAKPPKGNESIPDLIFQLWIDAQQERKAELLQSILVNSSLNDDQRKRVWIQIGRLNKELGKNFLITAITEVFKLQDIPETIRAVFDNMEEINEVFKSKEEQNDLALTLLRCLTSINSLESKNKIAAWIRILDAGAVLRRLEELSPAEEDINVLNSYFPELNLLIKLREKAG